MQSFLLFASALICGVLLVRAEERVATNEPQFVSEGGERRVREGQSVELACEVSELGEFVLLWKFNRSTVLFAGNLRIHRDDRISRDDSSGALTIRDFRPENAGEYSCQVSTNPPQDILYHVHLMGPPTIQGEARSQVTVKKNERVELTCETSAHTVHWHKDSRALGAKPRLVMERATREDAGSYTCIASNEMGQTSREINLRVLYAPELKVVKRVLNAPIGQTVVVECVVDSEPSANVNWFRAANLKVLPSERFRIDRNETTASLTIAAVVSEDYDNYTCLANNSLGSAVRSVQVTGKPSTPVFTSAPLAGRGTNYLLEWTVESEAPILKYVLRWKSRDSDSWSETTVEPRDASLASARRYAFEMTSLEADRNYDVEVHAHNEWGATASQVFAFVTSWAHVTTPSLVVGLTLALTVQSFQ